jgi:hypothetical protein
MTPEPLGGGVSFEAGRDNRGAFATGLGSQARSVEAGIYIENYTVPTNTRPPGPIFYDLPSLPGRYQAREADIAQARAKLLGGSAAVGVTSAARSIGLQGMGGIGNTNGQAH